MVRVVPGLGERSRLLYGAVAFLLVCGMTGCDLSGSQNGASDAVTDSVVTLGPYARNTPVHDGDSIYELASVEICGPQWVRLSERNASLTKSTRAADGYRYVDATIVARSMSADPNDIEAPTPPHGEAFVIIDGERFEPVDWGEARQSPDLSAARLVYEFELPEDASGASLCLSTSEEVTLSFRLW